MDDRVGQQLGNYRLIRLLGRGGFADVYLGEHVHIDTQAAIKVLHAQLTPEDMEKFRTEARTLARLVHPQIVRLLDFGIENNTPFLVMDYAPNGSLRQRHPRGTILPLTMIVPYVTQVAEALQFAHGEKLIHRDIKPKNIFLGRHNEIVLGDFGIAVLSRTSRSQSIEEITGTVAYMAPEQLQGRPSRASDQYSLGIVVYEWLSGDVPFHGAFVEIASQHVLVPPPPLRQKVPSLSPTVEQVVAKALEKEPQKRFASVREFVDALEHAIKLALKTKEQWLDEGGAHYDAERYQEAIATCDRAVELDPNYAVAYHNRGLAYSALQEYQHAIADYDRAIQLDSTDAKAYFYRGLAYAELKEYEQAISDYDRAIQLDPNFTMVYHNRGNVYRKLKKYQRAIVDYGRAIQLDPKLAVAYHNRGLAYRNLKEYQRAIVDYDHAITLDPNYAVAYDNRGLTYYNLQEYQRAIVDYDRAIQLNPNNAVAYDNRGNAYSALQENQRAIADYDRAIQLNPNYARAYAGRGLAFYYLKNYQMAAEDFDRALELDPSIAWVNAEREEAYRILKRPTWMKRLGL